MQRVVVLEQLELLLKLLIGDLLLCLLRVETGLELVQTVRVLALQHAVQLLHLGVVLVLQLRDLLLIKAVRVLKALAQALHLLSQHQVLLLLHLQNALQLPVLHAQLPDMLFQCKLLLSQLLVLNLQLPELLLQDLYLDRPTLRHLLPLHKILAQQRYLLVLFEFLRAQLRAVLLNQLQTLMQLPLLPQVRLVVQTLLVAFCHVLFQTL